MAFEIGTDMQAPNGSHTGSYQLANSFSNSGQSEVVDSLGGEETVASSMSVWKVWGCICYIGASCA